MTNMPQLPVWSRIWRRPVLPYLCSALLFLRDVDLILSAPLASAGGFVDDVAVQDRHVYGAVGDVAGIGMQQPGAENAQVGGPAALQGALPCLRAVLPRWRGGVGEDRA